MTIKSMQELTVPMTTTGFCLKSIIRKTVRAKIIVANRGINSTASQSASFPESNQINNVNTISRIPNYN